MARETQARSPTPREPIGRAGMLVPGEIVAGNFSIEKVLGRGSVGTVYPARDLHLERLVALKVSDATDQQTSSRLVREAGVLAKLNNPHIVHVQRTGVTDDGHAFIAMEFVEGHSLGPCSG
jgi:serine/threonine-protein kinase